METDQGGGNAGAPASPGLAARLLQALEALRADLGAVADELIRLLRQAGIRPGSREHGRGCRNG